MTKTLDYSRIPPPSRALVLSAWITLFYPILPLALFYLEWVVTWRMLGHPPRWGLELEQSGSVSGTAPFHALTLLSVALMLLAAPLALILNVQDVLLRKPTVLSIVMRAALLLSVWLGFYAIWHSDPGGIQLWWGVD